MRQRAHIFGRRIHFVGALEVTHPLVSPPRKPQRRSQAAIDVIEVRRLLHHLPIERRRPLEILLVESLRGGFERFDGFRGDLFKLLPNGPLAIHVSARSGWGWRLRPARLSEGQGGENNSNNGQEPLGRNLAHNFSPMLSAEGAVYKCPDET